MCGISSLGIDHTQILGDTIEKIAWQKGGIFKVGDGCQIWLIDLGSLLPNHSVGNIVYLNLLSSAVYHIHVY